MCVDILKTCTARSTSIRKTLPALPSKSLSMRASSGPARDAHLRSADFLDVENFSEITFRGNQVVVIGEVDYRVTGELTIRGVTRPVTLDVHYLGQWQTPWWEDGADKGPKTRAGFVARTTIDRQEFRVSWNDKMDKGGIVVSNTVEITIDAEAILEATD
jgi:polyisoprenoid-binding protein YceI